MFPTVGRPIQAGVTQHVSRMRRVACRILGREDLADDAVQEALITAHEVRELPSEHLEAWLLRTVTHRSLAARRAHLRRKRNEQTAAETLATRAPSLDPERRLHIKQLGEQIVRAVGSLPIEQRQARWPRDSAQVWPCSTLMSRGRPSTCSAMMLRWTANVPPPTVRAGENR